MSTLTVHDLPKKQVTAIKRRAKELGVTSGSYVKQLIDEDLESSRMARSKTFAELAAPFRKAFDGVSDEELDRLVDAARTRHYQNPKRKR